jgi:hypothetical protein
MCDGGCHHVLVDSAEQAEVAHVHGVVTKIAEPSSDSV